MQGTRVIVVAIVMIVVLAGTFSVYFALQNTNTTTQANSTTTHGASSSITSGSIFQTSYSSTESRAATFISSNYSLTTATRSTVSPNFSQDWLTYHDNLARTGVGPSEPTVQSKAPSFQWRSPALDGAIYAEPLVDGNLVIAATENNSVYAINASNGNIVWFKNLGLPVSGSSLPCGDINPSGITGTPVIDPATNTLYVVAYLAPSGHVLFALSISDGQVKFQRIVNPTGVSVSVEQQRGALSLSKGMVYIPYGGLAGDCGQYHGFILGVQEDNSSITLQYQVPTGREGGIWAPSGMSIDSSGYVYVSTGNGNGISNFDFGDAVIKLTPTLKEIDYFAPTNWASLNSGDTDIGSVAPLVLGNETIFQIGKQGVGYLLNASNLGKIGGEEFKAQICPAYGGLAFLSPVIYVPCNDGIVALEVNFSSHSFNQLWKSSSFYAGSPIVSGGAVWSMDTHSGVLYALNMTEGSAIFNYNLGSVAPFATPSSGDGQIFCAADESIIAVTI